MWQILIDSIQGKVFPTPVTELTPEEEIAKRLWKDEHENEYNPRCHRQFRTREKNYATILSVLTVQPWMQLNEVAEMAMLSRATTSTWLNSMLRQGKVVCQYVQYKKLWAVNHG